MELNDLRLLLDKYENGETSVQEERELKVYFKSHDVSQEFTAYKQIFAFSSESKKIGYSKEVQLNAGSNKKWAFVGIAASILIIMSFYFFNDGSSLSLNKQNLGTIEDPEQAYLKTKETLKMVAEVFNDGREELEHLDEFNKTKNKFIKEQ